jgi:uncharacterized membrane protein YgaE (UPF0421/DUF939 family)
MARKKEDPKPLFDLKHDFYASLDHALQQAINLMQAVDQAVDLSPEMSAPIKQILTERSAAMRKALMSED